MIQFLISLDLYMFFFLFFNVYFIVVFYGRLFSIRFPFPLIEENFLNGGNNLNKGKPASCLHV